MEIFNKIGKKASEAYKVTADKTGKLAKEAKLRMKIADLKSQISDIYKEIGKKVYENHVREEKVDLEKELEEECTKIDVMSAEIETNLKQCLELKDKRKCEKCFAEIDKDVKFCPECGAKQEEVEENEAKEVEIVENKEETKSEESDDEESKSEENTECQDDSCEDLKKTVEVESDVNLEEDKTVEEIKYEDE